MIEMMQIRPGSPMDEFGKKVLFIPLMAAPATDLLAGILSIRCRLIYRSGVQTLIRP